MTPDELAHYLRRQRYRVGQEIWLQADIERSLHNLQIAFEREVRLPPAERIDFLAAGGIGIEAKTRCAPRKIFRQLERYAEREAITSLILITGTALGLPPDIKGKPLFYVSTGRASL
jgi:hypothetical protein